MTTAAPPAAIPGLDEVMAQAGRENFPVASLLLPRRSRQHLLAIYGFARLTDDIGDEAAGDRLALLDWLEEDLTRAFGGEPTHPILRQLAPTLRELSLPPEPFQHLIEANRRDQIVHRYETFDELLGYCELSANPVGHLVLAVLGRFEPALVRWSDRICSALQLVEHCQDVAEDARRGRVYLPAEDLERFGCRVDDLLAPSPSPSFRQLMAFEVTRARALLAEGAPLVRALRGRPRIAVAGFAAGGRAALDAIEDARFDVLSIAPRPTRRHLTRTFLRTLGRR